MNPKRLSLPVMLGIVAFIAFLAVLTYFVTRSNHVKKNISTATAIGFNRAFTGAVIKTTVGDIEIHFFQREAPVSIYNFIKLAEKRFYDRVKFHYVLRDFLVQSGDPLSKGSDTTLYGTGTPGYTLPDELSNIPMGKGSVAMATIGKETSGSQFFIVTADSLPGLTGKFTIFAEVISGFETLERINSVPTDDKVPRYPIEITSIEIE